MFEGVMEGEVLVPEPVPVPRVSRPYRQVERLASVSDTTKLSLSSLVQFLSLIHLPRR